MNDTTHASSVPALSASSGVPVVAPASGDVTGLSLDSFAHQIQARERPDKSHLQAFHHPCFDAPFFIGPMSSKGYLAVDNVAQYIPAGPQAGQKMSQPIDDGLNRNYAYLMHAVWLESDKGLVRMTREMASALWEMEGAGPGNRTLVNAIKVLNPPREYLNQQLTNIWAMSTATTIVVRALFQFGLGEVLLNFLAPSSTPEEKAEAAAKIQKVEELVLDFEPYFQTQEMARKVGIFLDDPATRGSY